MGGVQKITMERKKEKAEIIRFFTRFTIFIGMIIVLFGIIFGITTVKNNDMFPKLSAGDVLLYYRLDKKCVAQDVVVIKKEHRQYIGRVVAKEGDKVELAGSGQLMINDSVVVENDIFYQTFEYEKGISYPLTLKKGQYFILCDHREGAKDSRIYGAVDRKEIKGKVMAVLRRSGL